MGLFDRDKDWVRGTARVVGTSQFKPKVSAQNLFLRAIVEAPGIPPYDTERLFKFVMSAKWPSTGDVLPVLVKPDNPKKWKVVWDEVETGKDRADQLAAEMLRQQQEGDPADGPASGGPAGQDVASDVVDQLRDLFPGATITTDTTTTTGMPGMPPMPPVADTGGGITGAGAGGGVNVTANQSDKDPVERLEKLAKLHAAGIIDDAQFEQLKAQILDQT